MRFSEYSLIAFIAVLLTATPVTHAQMQFGHRCIIENVLWTGQNVSFLVWNPASECGMAVCLIDGQLHPRSGLVSLDNVCGLGRNERGDIVQIWHRRAPGSEAFVFTREHRALPGHEEVLGTMHPLEGESRVTFLPSRPGAFLTRSHLGFIAKQMQSMKLTEYFPYCPQVADISKDLVLTGISAARPSAASADDWARLCQIDFVTGQVKNVRLRSATTQSGKQTDQLFVPKTDQITGIVADSSAIGWFYVAIGDFGRGGRLLRIGPNGECELKFRRESGPYLQMAGTPQDVSLPAGSSMEEPVLALACDSQQRVHFVTPRGVYRLTTRGEEFVGVPEFTNIGGFLIATNIREFILALSTPGQLAVRSSRVFLLNVPLSQK